MGSFVTELEEGVRVNPSHLRSLRPNPATLWSRIERDHPAAIVALREAGGKASQRPTDVGKRDWGDGRTSRKQHIIEEIGSERIVCRCGATVEYGPLPAENAWDLHRGVTPPEPTVYRYGQLATDDEVGDFLSRAIDPHYHFDPRGLIDTAWRPAR